MLNKTDSNCAALVNNNEVLFRELARHNWVAPMSNSAIENFGIIDVSQKRGLDMTAVLEAIDNMDVSEKVQTKDYIWSSLESANAGYRPPAWHERELARRQRLYNEGKVPVYDWADVKSRLLARAEAFAY